MNIQEYISSGIVESYVLGLADEADRTQFEQMCAAHAEVSAARDAFERSLEQHALANAVRPPVTVRAGVYEKLGIEPGNSEKEIAKTPVVAMKWPRYLVAASVILLAGSTVLNFYFFNRYKEYSARYEELVAQNSELVKNNQAIQTNLNEYRDALVLLKDPAMAVIKLSAGGVPGNGSPDSSSIATVYWNTRSKDVYLVINQLPQPAADKQYQLWAIVDGQPVDAGVFTMANSVAKMKNIPRAQLFAITLEQKGGSTTPKGPMYVLGKT